MSDLAKTIVHHLDRLATAQENQETASVAAAADAASALASLSDSRSFGARGYMNTLSAGLLLVDDTAYWVYQGYFAQAAVIKYVRFHLVTPAVGTAQAAEVALATSPLAPNRASQVLTALASSGSLGDLTGSAGMYANASSLDADVPAGSHLWAGIRVHMTGTPTQPTLLAVGNDMGQGQILKTATAGALTGAGPWTGATITQALTAMCPILSATED